MPAGLDTVTTFVRPTVGTPRPKSFTSPKSNFRGMTLSLTGSGVGVGVIVNVGDDDGVGVGIVVGVGSDEGVGVGVGVGKGLPIAYRLLSADPT